MVHPLSRGCHGSLRASRVAADVPVRFWPMADLERSFAWSTAWGAETCRRCGRRPGRHPCIHGDSRHVFRWASVTKPFTALAVLIARDRGMIELDEPAGPPGATVRHLLAHTSGLAFEAGPTLAAPGRRRIYSNAGIDLLGALVAERAGGPFETGPSRAVARAARDDRTRR